MSGVLVPISKVKPLGRLASAVVDAGDSVVSAARTGQLKPNKKNLLSLKRHAQLGGGLVLSKPGLKRDVGNMGIGAVIGGAVDSTARRRQAGDGVSKAYFVGIALTRRRLYGL